MIIAYRIYVKDYFMYKIENRMFVLDKPEQNLMKYCIKYTLSILKGYLYKLVLIGNRKSSPKKYSFSICSIFKNEAPFLKEFIEYHRLVGFEHFYFYNNNSEDDYLSVLKPYIDAGIVTLTEWPPVPGQQKSFEHFYANFKNETNWVSFLDLDEFICPLKETKIREWIKPFEKYPLILMYWQMFGTSGRLDHDNKQLVTEQYVNSWDKLYAVGKLLYNTDYDIVKYDHAFMHGFKVKCRGLVMPPINTFGYFVEHNIHRYKNEERTIQVNHYWSKAYETYKAKHARGSAVYGKSWKTFDKFVWHENFNRGCNYAIYRFMAQLKLKMLNNYPE